MADLILSQLELENSSSTTSAQLSEAKSTSKENEENRAVSDRFEFFVNQTSIEKEDKNEKIEYPGKLEFVLVKFFALKLHFL